MISVMPTLDLTTDGHVHTSLCLHAAGNMEEYVEAALAKGLRRLVFLEHFEAGINSPRRTWLTPDDFEIYRREGARLQQRYAGRIEIGLGVEVGYNPREVEATLVFLRDHAWDRVGISCHFLEIAGRHYNLLSRNEQTLAAFSTYGVDRALAEYFALLAQAVEQLPGTVLCHLDAALRHHPEIAPALAAQTQSPVLERIFKLLAAKKMALEINTSGFAHHRRQAYPAPALLARAAAHHLPLAIGSDAHAPAEVGRYFNFMQ
ncbi:histidinol-phosphatase HisJ family protein [Desulfurivibrio dismutans]|uniref:histidinol-phosphatase HisJ family protein n=1 Tax=Desulfurivibrio dismutans TaxID=1398908 RepID=UPI0023D9E712|nr:histidinol-phosphatase HisJ family protein [Desulfurivibrio alkaliphilus]MDF1613644.1 histidinol-phosphatase HisJ family protein [Desulfurivibrio alkaliphilus]